MQTSLLENLFAPEIEPIPENLAVIKQQISLFAATGCSLAVVAGMPMKFKAYLDALLAVSKGLDEFKATNQEIARYICSKKNIKPESALREVTRYATGFFAWQDKVGIALVNREVGYKDRETSKHIPSKYKLPILQTISKILTQGGWNKLTRREQDAALNDLLIEPDNLSGWQSVGEDSRNAIHELKIDYLRNDTGSTQSFPGGRPKGSRKLSSYLKTALTMVQKTRGKCGYDYESIKLLKQISQEITEELDSIPDLFDDEQIELQENSNEIKPDTSVHSTIKEERTVLSNDKKDLETQGGIKDSQSSSFEDTRVSAQTENQSPPCVSKGSSLDAALLGLKAFESVGVESFFSVYKCEISKRSLGELNDTSVSFRQSLKSYLLRADTDQISFCVRPIGDYLIQIDDCNAEVVKQLEPFSFLIIETSPDNFQCWLALSESEAEDRSAIRERLLRYLNDTGANGGAYNSLRFPGSRNFKKKHAVCDFPRVKVVSSVLSNFVTETDLDNAELLAPPVFHSEKVYASDNKNRSYDSPKCFPSWNRELSSAPLKVNGEADRSVADFRWCLLALRWGWDVSEVSNELRRVSPKAEVSPNQYIERTVRRAARLAV